MQLTNARPHKKLTSIPGGSTDFNAALAALRCEPVLEGFEIEVNHRRDIEREKLRDQLRRHHRAGRGQQLETVANGWRDFGSSRQRLSRKLREDLPRRTFPRGGKLLRGGENVVVNIEDGARASDVNASDAKR